MYTLRKNVQKLENILFLHIITTFHDFALIIKATRAKTVVMPIWKIENICVWFIHSWIKKRKKIQCKKE